MSKSAVVLTVRLTEGRYHGTAKWPPSPFRLYQALVAGVLIGESDSFRDEVKSVFEWLEQLPPPVIATPQYSLGTPYVMYVPNNDIDKVVIGEKKLRQIKTEKRQSPLIMNEDSPFLYAWFFEDSDGKHAEDLIELSHSLFQFGRGVDMAYAEGKILQADEVFSRIDELGLTVYSPSEGGNTPHQLRVPMPGSYTSLVEKYDANRKRFSDGNLTQAPPARFSVTSYGAKTHNLLFDIIHQENGKSIFYALSLHSVYMTVELIRNSLAKRLKSSFGEKLIDQIIVGKNADDFTKTQRIQLVPIPSIGFAYADRAIRRILVRIPPNCPIPIEEIKWAIGSLSFQKNAYTHFPVATSFHLVPTSDEKMLHHYGIDGVSHRKWRTVTPVVSTIKEKKLNRNGTQRSEKESRLGAALQKALFQSGIRTHLSSVHTQKEPFAIRNIKTNEFEIPDRYKGREVNHTELTFHYPIEGPVIVGDGRYLGLGICAPVEAYQEGIWIYELREREKDVKLSFELRTEVSSTIRRALMARAEEDYGYVPKLFSGHEPDGSPARTGRHEHIFITTIIENNELRRVLIIAPWKVDKRVHPTDQLQNRFDKTVRSLAYIAGNKIGRVEIGQPKLPERDNQFIRTSYRWKSITPYHPTTHPKIKDVREHITQDIKKECERRGFPLPKIEILDWESGPRGGNIRAKAFLEFSVKVEGPILLGKESHFGEGAFISADR